MAHVAAVYRRHYLLTRPQLVAATGGGISLRAVLAVAHAHAGAADFTTGRASRPLLGDTGSPAGITAATGLGKRTAQRARTWLRQVGLATEIAAGRHRTYTERMDSWRRGDRHRGWTADYALHPSTTHPATSHPSTELVDNLGTNTAGHTPHGTPPRSGSSSLLVRDGSLVTTGEKPENRRAPRTATTKNLKTRARRRPVPDPRGLLLATRWRSHPDTPTWALRNTPGTWAALLAHPARHGWTARDLNQILTDHANTGHRLLTTPRRPIGYLSWLLTHHGDLADRPCALDDARYAADLAAANRRKTEQAAAHTTRAKQQADAHTALQGPGRAAARAVLDQLRARRRP